MNLKELIIQHHPELKEKYESEQYALAGELIGMKLALDLDQEEMAKRIGVDYGIYLQMESGSLDIPVADYQKALASFQ